MSKLFKHQARLLKKNPDKTLLVWETGTGKTRASIEWAKLRPATNTLIICPKALKTNWRRQLIKCDPEGLVTPILRSKEEFRRDWEKLPGCGNIIIDEAHYFSGPKSQMSKALFKYIRLHRPPSVLGLTATPYLSSPMNIYVLAKHLGQTGYTWSYPYFMQTYFDQVYMGMRAVPIVKKNIEKLLSKQIKQIADVVAMSECADVPPDNPTVEYFSLTPAQEKAIKGISDINFITRWTKKHQICGGTLKGDAYTPTAIFDSEKLERASTLAEENEKIIFVCRYNHEIEVLKQWMPLNVKTLVINGDVKDKQAVLDEANVTDRCILLVNAACSEGWEAKTFGTMVFYSYDFSLKNYIQMKGRIQRIDALQVCNYVSLVVQGTIDEDVYKTVVEKKQSFHLKIYEVSNP